MAVTHMKNLSRASTFAALCMGTVYLASIAAQSPDAPRTIDLPQQGAAPSGPYPVVIEHDPGLSTHTIYRPAELTLDRYPMVVWGEGGCAKNGLTFPEYLSEIASYGVVIVADGPPIMPSANPASKGKAKGAPGNGKAGNGKAAAKGTAAPAVPTNMLDGTALVVAMDWMERQVADSASRFYQKVDTERVAAMGMSCGGLMSYGASADPRVATVGIWNSGLIEPDAAIFAGLHSPVIIITGGESDIAYANGKRDFETMPAQTPVFYGVYPSVGHGGTYNQDNGGAFGEVAVAWLKWQLMNDESSAGKGYFAGASCKLCTDSDWITDSRSLR